MDQGMYTAAAGAIAMEERLSIIANNLANVNTVGFKKDAVSYQDFQKALDASMLYPGQFQTKPVDVVIGGQYIDATQGGIRETGNPLDAAIVGEGFFAVSTPDGIRYTRAGDFTLSTEGLLVTQQGYPVQGEGGDITIGNGKVAIDPHGTITVDGTVVDRLQVVTIQEAGLERQGNSLYAPRQGFATEPVESPEVRQGFIESSNVDPVIEMVGLISTQRAYEAFQRVIRSVNDTYTQSMQSVGSTV
ncbi:MAG TPA: flagellar basal-body rod protein FlgF [Deltaproteobacteria bacterium]|jgi:flagellar basal-body rod protein FlgG|nr:flagellar basal-body rod protein FlgF [Deltaproteobacteria bacterium]HOI08573.1 flagellar basal-body rod protein FlgF [Deltaproteobacteria bacterium]